ncbi:MAG TPA: DUF3298 domain-containing protein [Candidatus Ozemobacteraceae bacterium]|nr:DUF3298 domain-containing protein [Candidatus Ozemobacteraceae bacterium]
MQRSHVLRLISILVFVSQSFFGPGLWAESTASAPPQMTLASATGGLYTGTIGERLSVIVSLQPREADLYGSYRYTTSLRPISLEGKRSTDATWQLKEWMESDVRSETPPDEPPPTGFWEAREDKNGSTVTGFWFSSDRKKKLPLTLRRVAQLQVMNAPHNIEAFFPVFVESGAQTLNEHLASEVRALITEQHAELQAVAAEFVGEGYEDAQERIKHLGARLSYTVDAWSPAVLSVLVTQWDYQGGAHGNTRFSTINLRRAADGTLSSLRVADLFQPQSPWAERVAELITRDLQRQKASAMEDNARDFATDLTSNTLTWSLTPSALLIHFAPYEVGCYAEGDFHVAIPWKDLRRVLKKDIPGSFFSRP